jgi:hypothetical protein
MGRKKRKEGGARRLVGLQRGPELTLGRSSMRLSILAAIFALILLPLPAAAAAQDGMSSGQASMMECSSEHMMKMADMMGQMQHDMTMMTDMMDHMKAEMMGGMSGMDQTMPMGGMDGMVPMDPMPSTMPMAEPMTGRMEMMGAMMGHMQHEMEMMAMMHEMMGCPMMPGGM